MKFHFIIVLLCCTLYITTIVAKKTPTRAQLIAQRRAIDHQLALFSEPDCNQNGFFYSDTQSCKCFSCFDGESCENFNNECVLDDGGGNPLLFEQFWRSVPLNLTEESYYRSPYQFGSVAPPHISAQGYLLPQLADRIKDLHKTVGNIANVENKYVVIGSGATLLIGAASYACKKLHGPNKDMYIYAEAPYYDGYATNFVGLGVDGLSFTTQTNLSASDVIQYVTYPNNPTNTFRTPVYPASKAACTIHDQVYFWPSLVNMSEAHAPLDTSVSLFSMSKLTGHAGTRLGWALVDDKDLALAMNEYITNIQIHISIDAQHRTFKILDMLKQFEEQPSANSFFDWVRKRLYTRWAQLEQIFSNAQKFTQLARPNGFYAWVKCLDTDNCHQAFVDAGIAPQPGTLFGATNQYVRLELVTADSVWAIMVDRLNHFIQ